VLGAILTRVKSGLQAKNESKRRGLPSPLLFFLALTADARQQEELDFVDENEDHRTALRLVVKQLAECVLHEFKLIAV